MSVMMVDVDQRWQHWWQLHGERWSLAIKENLGNGGNINEEEERVLLDKFFKEFYQCLYIGLQSNRQIISFISF